MTQDAQSTHTPLVPDLLASYRSGSSTPQAEVERVIARMDEVEPVVHSVLARHPQMDHLVEAADPAGSLYGIPVLVKDNIDTVAPLPTTAGSLALCGNSPRRDAPLVRRLTQAGALIVGKANMSEWGNFRATRSTRGWSAVGGLTLNPHALDRSAGGSSSGSAAAVAAGIVSVSIGTETDGSIIAPAELCGVVGLKPTVGIVPGEGIIPISKNQDTAGPITSTVREAAMVLDVLTQRPSSSSYTHACEPGSVAGLRIGVVADDVVDLPEGARALHEEAYRALERAGAELVRGVRVPSLRELGETSAEFELLLHDFRWDIEDYLRERNHPQIQTLKDIIAFNRSRAHEELRYFGQDVLERSAAMGTRDTQAYRTLRDRTRAYGQERGIDRALAQAEVDIIAGPGFGPAWKVDLLLGDGPDLRTLASPLQASAVAGYPVMTVPVGLLDYLPVGLTFMGSSMSELDLLRAAAATELALGPGPRPGFRSAGAG